MIANALKRSDGNINYPGLIAAWSAKGKTNDDEDRATLKDLTGNGHDITLNGFAFSGMSGYNVYTTDFSKWAKSSGGVYNIVNKHKINITSSNRIGIAILYADINNSSIMGIKKQKYKIQGLLDNQSIILGNDNYDITLLEITTDGEYEVDWSENQNRACCILCNFVGECNITIEVIPEYPDALVFDGVDDYGVNEDMPIQNDYTIIVKRNIFNLVESYSNVISKRDNTFKDSDFMFERGDNTTYSFGKDNQITLNGDIISWQTATSYNGNEIVRGSAEQGTNIITIGINRNPKYPPVGYTSMAFYSAYLFDRSLDEQEIKAFIRKYIDPEYLLPSEIPTPDCYYDFSQGSNDDENRETIKDYSGNGKDAKAYNFDWGGMSGYGGYGIYSISSWLTYASNNYTKYGRHKIEITVNDYNFVISLSKNEIKINDVFKLKFDRPNIVSQFVGCEITQINELEYSFKIVDLSINPRLVLNKEALGQVITIEQIPEYPGALVFDGTDDYVSLDAFDSGFKTVFMVCKINKIHSLVFDQKTANNRQFRIYNENELNEPAYNMQNTDGITYINQKINTTLTPIDLLNKKQCIAMVNDTVEMLSSFTPTIATAVEANRLFTNMALYKFLGFKEALTEEQIQAVIKKYNLLDGVDEIEVS